MRWEREGKVRYDDLNDVRVEETEQRREKRVQKGVVVLEGEQKCASHTKYKVNKNMETKATILISVYNGILLMKKTYGIVPGDQWIDGIVDDKQDS